MKKTPRTGSRYAALTGQGLDIKSAFPTSETSPILFSSSPPEAVLESEELWGASVHAATHTSTGRLSTAEPSKPLLLPPSEGQQREKQQGLSSEQIVMWFVCCIWSDKFKIEQRVFVSPARWQSYRNWWWVSHHSYLLVSFEECFSHTTYLTDLQSLSSWATTGVNMNIILWQVWMIYSLFVFILFYFSVFTSHLAMRLLLNVDAIFHFMSHLLQHLFLIVNYTHWYLYHLFLLQSVYSCTGNDSSF